MGATLHAMAQTPRVLALGLSESTWSRLRDPTFSDRLPWLTRAAARGACGITVAPIPLASEPLWATVVTGRSARAHGVFAGVQRDRRGEFRKVSAQDLAVPPIWRVLEEAGVPTGVFNLSITRRPEAATGFMIARGTTPGFQRTSVDPPSLYAPLHERFGAWAINSMPRAKSDWPSVVPREIDRRTDVLVHLLESRPWRFALAQLPDVSRAQHRFWADADDGSSPCRDALRSVYAASDGAIARIVEAAGPETIVFVFSECGAGPIRHGIQLDAWLEREGFLSRRGGPRRPLASKAAFLLAREFRRVARLLPGLVSRCTETVLLGLKVRTKIAVMTSDYDWPRTVAFSPGADGAIYFNIAGRDPQGVVAPGDRQQLTREIRSRLLSLRDPEGRRVVEDVIPQEAWGPHADLAPDLTIVWDDDAYMPASNGDARTRVFVDWCPDTAGWRFTGAHRREGMLLVDGPGIETANLGHVETVDLVPTWLELLGVPMPEGLEGSSFAPRLKQLTPRTVLENA
jgi:predicted AlkP superfamily phosphohydrolase/phosphomutase